MRGVDRVDETSARSGSARAASVPGRTRTTSTTAASTSTASGLVDPDARATAPIASSFRRTAEFFVDTCSRVDMPPVTELRRTADGKLVCALERGRRVGAAGRPAGSAPERFVGQGRDGKTDIYGVIFRPTNFDPAKKYPVVEDIYAGPQGSFVPEGVPAVLRPQALAELGFIVVQIDGMGTEPLQGVPRRLLEEPGRRRLPRPHPLDQGRGARSTRTWT